MAMTIDLYCLVPAVMLPYVWTGVHAPMRKKQLGTIDNKHPRGQVASLTGNAARAYAAHLNAFEALMVFAPAVIVAHITGADPVWSARLAIAWVVFRVLHGIAYVANIDKLRSLLWGLALACALGLFGLAARA
jgi:uncharacterized MAPEG superfamily protein